ncbi:MAG: FAD binding domain-containing protein [bacterium]|jgi:CO/xanthine dehydrogenase FAD-binding subunit
MKTFEAILPGNVSECIDVLSEHGRDAAVLAGGTDLFVLMKMGIRTPALVIHTASLEELGLSERRGDRIVLGPALTHSQIAGSELLAGLEVLRAAAASIGSPQVRNLGTLGGNIVNASPAGDLYPALLALDANVLLKSANGEREVSLEDFVTGPGETIIEPEEMLIATSFVDPGAGGAGENAFGSGEGAGGEGEGAGDEDGAAGRLFTGFAKVGLRNALAISVANAALVARAADGALTGVKIACGAVAPTAIRMRPVEELLEGRVPTEALIEEAARIASSECDPLSDIRATAEYRRHVTGVVVSRLIRKARAELLGADSGTDASDD